MANIIIIAKELDASAKLAGETTALGYSSTQATYKDKLIERIVRETPELILMEMDGHSSETVLHDLTHGNKLPRAIPILSVITQNSVGSLENLTGIDDFVVKPYAAKELAVRIKRLIQKNVVEDELIRYGELVIDQTNCEVRVSGKVVELTFKEYELLKFLAKEPGRVFTREALLNKVWGYDYFGGDRTVDVHIRRLRSKIEISNQVFIDTVRNIGYRFKK